MLAAQTPLQLLLHGKTDEEEFGLKNPESPYHVEVTFPKLVS
jgi:hypothetical protein